MRLDPISLFDFETRAKQALPHDTWDFIEAGAFDEITTKRNRAAFNSIALRPRFLVDVQDRDLSTTVMGHKISFPVMISPAGQHRVAHNDGELATARAAGSAETIMMLSTSSTYSMEDVSRAGSGPLIFQLYHRGYDLTEMLVHRAEEAGFIAICVTVDTPAPGTKERDARNRWIRPRGMELANFVGEEANQGLISGTDEATNWNQPQFPPLTWSEIGWLRSLTSLPIIMKGIRTGEDARLCVENGVNGILVSNHGGRQVDGTLSSIETLPEIVDSVKGQAEIYLDSGIRRGTDVLRALAMGANAVSIGRPLFWGLAVDGEDGVRMVLELLRQELDRAMGYCGATSIDGITRDMVALPGEPGGGWVQVQGVL